MARPASPTRPARSYPALLAGFLLATLLAVSVGGCQSGATAQAGYKPPFLPVKLVIDSTGAISIQADAEIVTPVGDFSVGLGVSSSGGSGAATSSASALQPAGQSILVVIRHRQNGQIVDSAYQIRTGQDEVAVVLDGQSTLYISNRRITVDASAGTIKSIVVTQAGENLPPTATPTATPPPPPGTVLYQADWSSGLNGWHGGAQWKATGGTLVSDGTGANTSLRESASSMAVLAPYQPSGADYAVQAEIQAGPCVGNYPYGACDAGLGLIARLTPDGAGYVGGVDYVHWDMFSPTADLHTNDAESGPQFGNNLGGRDFAPGDGWHTYRLEVRGNRLTLLIDGAVYAQATDHRYLDPGQVGLEGYTCQIAVRSFSVIAL